MIVNMVNIVVWENNRSWFFNTIDNDWILKKREYTRRKILKFISEIQLNAIKTK